MATTTTGQRFIEDCDDYPHPCETFDAHWNGWATPVVTLDQLRALAARWDYWTTAGEAYASVTFDGDVPTFHSNPDNPDVESFPLIPDEAGLFHLSVLGFCFVAISPDWAGAEPDNTDYSTWSPTTNAPLPRKAVDHA